MARRGRFGRQPRVSPSLTNTLVSIAREMVAKQDQNIMDAWRNGGTFNGQKATDEAVLKYWAGREKGMSKDDPNYEAIKNNILQLNYGIEQSKMDLLHVQKKITDTQYAQFFLKWAGKVPRDSEFYRTLQKDAATLIESAKAHARASADKAKADAFNAFVKGTTESDIAVGNALTDAANKMAQASGLTITGDGEQVLGLLTKDIAANPDKYHALLDAIHKINPGWDGQVTQGFFAKSISQGDLGYGLIANRANKDGYATAYASATKAQSDMATWGSNLKVWPVAQSYNSAFNAFSAVWNDPRASQMDKMTAAKQFADRVNGFASEKGLDPATKAMLQADSIRVLGGDAGDTPSFGAAMLGHQGVDASVAAKAAYYVETDLALKTTPGAYVYAPVDKNGQFDPSGQGPLGVVPSGAVGPGAQLVAVPQLGGQAIMAAIAPHAVYANDPNDPNGTPKQVGYSLTYAVGGKTVTMYAYQDGSGKNHWSLSAPWADGVTAATDAKGDTYLTLATPPGPSAAEIDKQYGTNFTEQLKSGSLAPSQTVFTRDATGKVTGETKFSYKNGSFTAVQTSTTYDANGKVSSSTTTPIQLRPGAGPFDPTSVISGSRKSTGDIPGVTFNSPVAASMSANPESSDQVGHLAADPMFQQAFVQQTMTTLGTQNMMDPRIASAWSDLTTHDQPEKFGDPSSITARSRADLTYPGAKPDGNPAYAGSLSINFGGAALKVPNLPSYLGEKQADLSGVGGLAKAGAGFLAPILGIANPFATAGGVTPSVVPAAGNATPKTFITPTPTPVAQPTYNTPGNVLPPATPPAPSQGGGGGAGMNKAL